MGLVGLVLTPLFLWVTGVKPILNAQKGAPFFQDFTRGF